MNWLEATRSWIRGGYDEYKVHGFTYRVNSGNSDPSVAYKLHEVNTMAIEIISYIKRWISAADEDRLAGSDASAVPIGRLRTMYARLSARYDPDAIFESKASGEDTSFVVDQGEEVHMCVRVDGKYERETVLVAVLTHELSHIASSTPDHDDEFWENYGILQKMVARMGYVNVRDIEPGGAVHCAKVRIGKDELREIAGDGPNGGSRSQSGYQAYDYQAGSLTSYIAVPCARGICGGPVLTSPLDGVAGDITVPDYHSSPRENPLEGQGQRYRKVEFGLDVPDTEGLEMPMSAFPALSRYAPAGFATDRPITLGPKTLAPIPGHLGTRGRMTKLSNVPNPISVEFYSRYV